MSLTSRLFFLSMVVAISTTSFDVLSAQEIEPVRLLASGDPSPKALSIVYEPESGRVTVTAPEMTGLTALQLLSDTGLFTEECMGVDGAFDICEPEEVFKLEMNGFTTVDFGQILEPHLDGDSLLNDLKVNGATAGGGFNVGDGPILVHTDFLIPEPTSVAMVCCGLCLVVAARRRHRAC